MNAAREPAIYLRLLSRGKSVDGGARSASGDVGEACGVVSIVISFIVWWRAEGFGMIFTGMATDFNSGLLLIIMALACWPRIQRALVPGQSGL